MMTSSHFSELPKRSVVKAITYRGLILCSDSVIIYLLTHRLDLTLGVIFLSNIASTLLFIFHERMWDRVHWGKTLYKRDKL